MAHPLLRLALSVCLLLAVVPQAQAGVAIVQAVEQASGICAGDTAEAAFDCAKTKCAEAGAFREDCLEMAWCLDGETVDVFMQSKAGNHWHEFYCGWRDRATAIKAGQLACNADRMAELMECAPVQVIDEQGVASDIAPDELK